MVPNALKNMEGFTKQEIEKATIARETQGILGNVSATELELLVSNKKLDDLTFNFSDFQNSKQFFGPSRAIVRGKTVRVVPDRVDPEYITIPKDFILLHKKIVLVADVMFVNSVAFLVTMSRKIKFLMVEHLRSRSAKQLVHSLKNVIGLYVRNNQHVSTILTDTEFTSVIDPILGKTVVNNTAAREHVAEIERSIRTVKERCREVVSTPPFDVLPKLIITNIIKFGVFWLNAFPVKNGCSEVLSPREVVTQMKISFSKNCQVPFGTYYEVHEDPAITNTIKAHNGPNRKFSGFTQVFLPRPREGHHAQTIYQNGNT